MQLKNKFTKWFFNEGYIKPERHQILLWIMYILFYDNATYAQLFHEEMEELTRVAKQSYKCGILSGRIKPTNLKLN